MNGAAEIAQDLRAHIEICQELLGLVEREGQALRAPGEYAAFDFYQHRKILLPRIEESVQKLKKHRAAWQRLPPEQRMHSPEVSNLLRLGQDLTMKVLMMDRENEQALLRRGLVPPQQLPSAQRQRPHYVAELYRRSSGH
jgi:hypothetical protein